MKTVKQGLLLLSGCMLLASIGQALAIEGLKVSVQSTNVVLSWPSTNDETYMVQYRPTLNATSSWVMLTNYLPPASSTNRTSFVHGSSGRAGFYRVVRDGAFLWGITNGMTLSGLVSLQVEAANDYGTLMSLALTENGVPVSDASIDMPPFQAPLRLLMDTTQMSNGVHQIAATARWDTLGNTNDESGGLFEADSPAVAVNVYNEISFPNWMSRFGELDNTLLIKAQSAHTDADWEIDVYDSQYQYIGTFGDHTYDGSIEVLWDLLGPFGEPHTNDSFFVFVVTTAFNTAASVATSISAPGGPVPLAGSGSASVPTPPTYRVTDPWPGYGAWVIVAQHAFDSVYDHDTLYEEIDGFVDGAQVSGYSVFPPPTPDGHAFPIHYAQTQADADWASFRQALTNQLSRNLVYFGHGAPNGLGANPNNPNRYLSAAAIANMLHTIPNNQLNRHMYRMVILDGCSTAAGTLPESFGIIHRENVPGVDYYNASLRPSAFAGWTADKWVGFLNGSAVNYDHVNFIIHIGYFLANGYGIKAAKDLAGSQPDVHFVNTSQFKVFGCWDLTFWAYNQ